MSFDCGFDHLHSGMKHVSDFMAIDESVHDVKDKLVCIAMTYDTEKNDDDEASEPAT